MPYSENHTKTAQSPGYTVQDGVKNWLGPHFKNLESPSLRLNKMMVFPIQGAGELNAVCACINEHGKKLSGPVYDIPGMISFRLKLAARMMIDQSGSVLNLGIRLHRNFSCPYIPGSALKGVTRHYAFQNCEDTDKLNRIFGNQERAGSVAFLNAFPADSNWKMVVDVLTKHNDPEEEHLDTKKTTPIFFPAVEKGAVFTFHVVPLKHDAGNDAEQVVELIKSALMEWGIGAKTSAGYGWFKEI